MEASNSDSSNYYVAMVNELAEGLKCNFIHSA